ncbi:MAG: TIGR04086 family membrane protein [Eubacterium sp.]|nr:TIGR04086 family membrane protein [Eubacterium sp.]
MDQMERSKNSAMPVLVDLVAMYVITGLLLVGLAALLGRMDLSDAAVSIGIIATYMISCFTGGFLIGKKKKRKKYLWGLCVGAFYFAVLLLGNLVVNRGLDGQLVQMLTTAVLCILSGMAGGMLS